MSADHTYFSTHSLVDVADEFSKDSGQLLVIDEVHKYSDWSRQLKQIYDTHPDMRIIFTGSSVLDIMDGVADLSRRVLHYTMYGLSFREYLELFHGISASSFSLEDILGGKAHVEGLIHPLPLFRQYIVEGYYPFALEGDFGGCEQVNRYIHGGEGTAQEAAAAIGFSIYRTEEMAALISELRQYNSSASAGEDIRFYGFDMQRVSHTFRLLMEACMELNIDTTRLEMLVEVEKPPRRMNTPNNSSRTAKKPNRMYLTFKCLFCFITDNTSSEIRFRAY